MSHNYDNWERLVAAVLKRELLLKLFHADSRSPSVLSDASNLSSSSFSSTEPYNAPVEKRKNRDLVFVSDYRPIAQLDDLLRASSVEALGSGTFTSVRAYKLDYGTIIVVKRLNDTVNNVSERDFKKHMRHVGDVAEHENVAALKAHYFSKYEKLMIYDYCDGGSVSALLHGKLGENRANVDWKVRLRIALDAARGLSHIHTQNGGKMIHGNIKSSNIVLNSRQHARVSDLGLASMVQTAFPRSSKCYAPEVKSTRNVSQASDVYSFGILLLEILTRKSPEPSLGREVLDLLHVTNSVSNKGWIKVTDGDLLLNASINDEVVRMLEIGISCVAESPKKRPRMSMVVKMIEDIGKMNMGNPVFMEAERSKLLFLGKGNSRFDLGDLSKTSAEVVREGIFGTWYRAVFENGYICYVKRLKNVVVTNNEFQRHMMIIERIEHKSVAQLMAYFYTTEEVLLLYSYDCQESLSMALHGNRSLDWTTRLKIALRAAKGIAYIHEVYFGQNLVHGNITTSNILLDKYQYVAVSDVGLGKLVSRTTFSIIRNAGYCAPEVVDNRKVTQASDVYNFGVVLLELLSAKPPQTTYKGTVMSLVRLTQSVVREKWASEVFDVKLLKYGDFKEEMMGMMQIALSCVDSVPERRPRMIDIVRMLKEIRGTVGPISRGLHGKAF